MTKRATYRCPACTNTITVFVELLEPPVCTNKHIKGGKIMKKVEENNEQSASS